MHAADFAPRTSVAQVEEGTCLAPRFDADAFISVVTTDQTTGEVLMLGVMTAEALRLTIQTGEAHYCSRSRKCLWHKGASSGLVQRVVEMRIDDNQDTVWLREKFAGEHRAIAARIVMVPEDMPIGVEGVDWRRLFCRPAGAAQDVARAGDASALVGCYVIV